MIKIIAIALSLVFLSGCESLKLRNIAKTAATTTATYAIAGPVPAVANLGTSMVWDEIVLDPVPPPQIKEVETKEQAVAYVAESLFMNAMYAFVAYLLITLIAVPFVRRWGYNAAKKKYQPEKTLDEQRESIIKEIMDIINKDK